MCLHSAELDSRVSGLVWAAMLVSLAIVITVPRPSGVRSLIAATILRLIFSVGLEPTLILLGLINVSLTPPGIGSAHMCLHSTCAAYMYMYMYVCANALMLYAKCFNNFRIIVYLFAVCSLCQYQVNENFGTQFFFFFAAQ